MSPWLNHPLEQGFARLRPIEERDLARWLDYLRSDAVRQGISWRPQTTQDLGEFVQATDLQKPQSQVRFAIARTPGDTMLGSIGLHSISLAHKSADVGYDIAPQYWGRGLATAACRAIVAWARLQGLVRIQATVLPDNPASLRVLEHAGFEPEGRLRKYRWIEGRACDVLVYSHLPA
jgi:RimJ/RimL family protein N-acetyltransferase